MTSTAFYTLAQDLVCFFDFRLVQTSVFLFNFSFIHAAHQTVHDCLESRRYPLMRRVAQSHLRTTKPYRLAVTITIMDKYLPKTFASVGSFPSPYLPNLFELHLLVRIWLSKQARRGVEAYVLIQTEIGAVGKVLPAVRSLPLVDRADDVTGPYDIIALLDAETLQEIGRQVVEGIQVIEGVTRTLTCPVGHLNLDMLLPPQES